MCAADRSEPIKVWSRGNRVCVRFFGTIGVHRDQDAAVIDGLEEATRRMAINLVMDFEYVEQLISHGLGIFKECFKRVIRENGTIRLINVSDQVYNALSLMGLADQATVEMASGKVIKPRRNGTNGGPREKKKKTALEALVEKLNQG